MGNENQWHWQEPGTAWKGVGIYHVTLVVPSRKPLLGKLMIPDNDPTKAVVELSPLGFQVKNCVDEIPVRHSEIRIIQLRMMPNHVHVILYVTQSMNISIKKVVQGFWQGVKKIEREDEATSVCPHTMRDNKRCSQIFTEMPFIRPLSRKGQLKTMIRYVQLNPQRLATMILKPGYFRVQSGIEIGGRVYTGVGNAEQLQARQYSPVHVRRVMVEAAEHGDSKALSEYMNGCVKAAREGTVMVSPFISPKEKEIMDVLLREKLPFVYIADNGFRDYYKPMDALFEAVAEGRVLILSPWEYEENKKHVTREECVAMNKMAEEICGEMNGR